MHKPTLLALLLVLPFAAAAGIHEDRAQAFCDWVSSRADLASDATSGYCSSRADKTPELLFSGLEDVLSNWRRDPESAGLVVEFDRTWLRVSEAREAEEKRAAAAQAAARRARAASEARNREAARLAEFEKGIAGRSESELCSELRRRDGSKAAYPEIVRRKLYLTSDMAMVAARKIRIGMSEGAMLCALGPAGRVNRTVTAAGVSKQFVYSAMFVYTENGVVTAFQD